MEKQIKITTYQNNSTGTTIYTIYGDDVVALSIFEDFYKDKNGMQYIMAELLGNDENQHTVTENIVMLWCLLKSGNENFCYSLDDFKKIMSKDRSIYAQYTQFKIEQKMIFQKELQEFHKLNPEEPKKKVRKSVNSKEKTS